MKGGKLIGYGSYGCVFDPPLLCEGETERKDGFISKLLRKTDAKDEQKENEKINNIDPDFKWHLRSYNSCMPKLPKGDDLAHTCPVISDKTKIAILNENAKKGTDNSMLKLYRNVIQEHGGTSVTKYINQTVEKKTSVEVKHKQLIDLILQSENLLLGIKELYEKDMCHFDIKPDNVVYNEKTKRFNFIDFGLTRKINKVKDFPSLYRAYWVWPLDAWMCYNPNYKSYIIPMLIPPPNISPFKSAVMMRHETSYGKEVAKTFVANYKNSNPYIDCLNTGDKIKSYLDYIKANGYDNLVRKISESIDTYSLGIVYLMMMVSFTGIKFNNNSPFLLDSKSKYYNELNAINDLIKVMVHSNSLERMRAPDVYKYFIDTIKPILLGKTVTTSTKHITVTSAPDMLPSGKIVTTKVCPPDKILNPSTNRCVSINGPLGKKLQKRQDTVLRKNSNTKKRQDTVLRKNSNKVQPSKKVQKNSNNKTKKICPADKILNPKTNRCVSRTGQIGKKLV